MATSKDELAHPSIRAELRGVSFSQDWLDAGGARTRYLTTGSQDKPPLLLVHGVGGHAEACVRNLKSQGEHFWTWAIEPSHTPRRTLR